MLTSVEVLRSAALVLTGLVGSTLALYARPALANPASVVPSAADPGDPADLHIQIDYGYEVARSILQRESVGDDVDPLAPLPKHRDLAFKQSRHLLTPRLDLGVYHDTWISVAMPIVIAQSRELSLDDGVTRATSSTLLDGFLPAAGFDARDPGTAPPGGLVFRGVNRRGLDQIHLGLGVAPMNQDRDSTKPTWKMGAELRLAIGKIMRFDAMDPSSEAGVGRGVHELRLWTSVARRYKHTEGWFEMFWQVPLTSKDGSPFEDPGFGATNTSVGQRGGISAGIETYLVDDPTTGNRISLDLGARVEAHFEGRDYSELWEVFAFAGDARGSGPLVLDANPVESGLQARSHPGITNFENYLDLGGTVALRAKLGDKVRLAAKLDLVWRTDHLITFADAGIDLPTCGAPPCENDVNDVVNPNTEEVNPAHAPRIDLVGHRYHSENNFGIVLGVEGQVLF